MEASIKTNAIHIVANSMAPFVYENAIVLGLPEGAKFRARFPIKWVDKKLVQNLGLLFDVEAILILRDWSSSRLIPIRYVEIFNAKIIGEVLYIEYFVRDYINYANMPELAELQQNSFDLSLKKELSTLNIENPTDKPMKPLVFSANFTQEYQYTRPRSESIFDSRYELWSNTIGRLVYVDQFNAFPFIKFEIIKSKTGKVLHPKNGIFTLQKNTPYSLSVFYEFLENRSKNERGSDHRSPKTPYMDKGPFWLSVTSSTDATELPIQRQKLSGRYDRLDLKFISNKKLLNNIDTLRLEFTVPKNVDQNFDPSFEVDVVYKDIKFLRILMPIVTLLIYLFINIYSSLESILSVEMKSFLSQFTLIIFTIQIIAVFNWFRRGE